MQQNDGTTVMRAPALYKDQFDAAEKLLSPGSINAQRGPGCQQRIYVFTMLAKR